MINGITIAVKIKIVSINIYTLSKDTVYLLSLFMLKLLTKHRVSDNAADLAYQLYIANNNVHLVFIPRDNTEEPQN